MVWEKDVVVGRMLALEQLVRAMAPFAYMNLEYGEDIFGRCVGFAGRRIVWCSFIGHRSFISIMIRNVTDNLDPSIGKGCSVFSFCNLSSSFFIP